MWEGLEKTRPTSWPALTLAGVAYATVLLASNLLQSSRIGAAIDGLEQASNGWVACQLVYPWIAFGLVAIFLFRFEEFRCRDVGWQAAGIAPAIVVTVLFWTAQQVLLCLMLLLSGRLPTWQWQGRFEGSIPAALVTQMLGNSLVEESFFRGFLLPQLYLHAFRILRRRAALVAALLGSLILFVLSHVPVLLTEGLSEGMTSELALFSLFGLVLAMTFLVTRNLFISVGLHSLWNVRPTVIEASWETVDGTWWCLTIVLLLGWWLRGVLVRRRGGWTSGEKNAGCSQP